jgi:PleD family two-component response regulator
MVVEGSDLRVSASFGVTVSDGSEKSPDFFVRVADEALYQAKAGGRNCVRALTFGESALASA